MKLLLLCAGATMEQLPDSPTSPFPPIDSEAAAPLTLEHFSPRFGLLVRGANRPPPAAIEIVDTMPAGLYVSVHIQGRASSGMEGSERSLRSHGLTVLAVRTPTRWRGLIGEAVVQALGIAMEIDAIRACGLGVAFETLFSGDNPVRQLQRAASFRMIEQARRALATDLGCPAQVLRLEADAMDIFLEGFESLRDAPSGNDNRHRALLLALSDAVEADLGRRWTMDDLAREAGMSVRTLSSHFRSEFACTPFEFLRERRLLCARDMLVQGDVSIAQISSSVGFGSSAHFSTAFRKRFGEAPIDFRIRSQG